MQPAIFQGRGGLVGLGHFYKHFVKKGPAGKILSFFLLDTLKTTFWMENLKNLKNSKMDTVGAFFTKSGHFFFDFHKREKGAYSSPLPPPPSCASAWDALIWYYWVARATFPKLSIQLYTTRISRLSFPFLRLCWNPALFLCIASRSRFCHMAKYDLHKFLEFCINELVQWLIQW